MHQADSPVTSSDADTPDATSNPPKSDFTPNQWTISEDGKFRGYYSHSYGLDAPSYLPGADENYVTSLSGGETVDQVKATLGEPLSYSESVDGTLTNLTYKSVHKGTPFRCVMGFDSRKQLKYVLIQDCNEGSNIIYCHEPEDGVIHSRGPNW